MKKQLKAVGGLTSIQYLFKVAKAVGFFNFYHSLTSKNTCKVCAYGMGGQTGAIRNEAGEFLQFCKKSVQAQLTDIQKAIPVSVFKDFAITDLRKLSARELERLGRLNNPLYKGTGDTHYTPISWEEALNKVIERLQATTPERTFFYSSGRSSNEAGFLLQLLARLYGTNNVNNCAYYCHQASSEGLSATIGNSTATITLEDLGGADLIFVIGANSASNHPRYLTELLRCRRRGGQVIIINPAKEPGLVRFAIPSDIRSMLTGGSEIASHYIQPNIGGDIALLKGIAKAVLESGTTETRFIAQSTQGFDNYQQDIYATDWDTIVTSCGVARTTIEAIAAIYSRSEHTIFSWSMGITHHKHGVGNVESIVNLALLRGMVGKHQAGLLPLRGHSNVQGIGSIGVAPVLKPNLFEQIEKNLGLTLPTQPGLDTMASMHAAYRGEIDLALLLGGNLYASNPDSAYAERALERIKFKTFLSTTLNQGHIVGVAEEVVILPVAARDEEPQPTTQESMFNFVRLSDGGIQRLNNVRSEVDIICDLASAVLDKSPIDFSQFKRHRNIRQAIATTVPGFAELNTIDETKSEFRVTGRTLHTPSFATSNGKAHFRVVAIPDNSISPDEFQLMTVRSEGQFNSIIYEEYDLFRGQKERWVVLMNKQDIERLGLKPNDHVTLVNDTGRMEHVKVSPFDITPGNLMTYYPEANVLIPTAVDTRSKTPAFKSVTVRIVREINE
jgi:molybdopterin-dependent oxidoreductase alpha subunit